MSDEIKDGTTEANEPVDTEQVETEIAQPRESELDSLATALKGLREVVSASQERKNNDGILSEDREKIEKAQADVLALRKQMDELQNARTMRKGEFELADAPAHTYSNVQMKSMIKAEAAEGSDIQQIQRANDDLYIGMKLLGVDSPEQSPVLKQYIESNYPAYSKGMGVGAGAGLGTEWIPTDFSNQLVRDVRLQLRVAALHPRFNMPTNPYTFPVEGADIDAYLVSEQTGDNADIASSGANRVPADTPGTSNLTFTAKKLGVRSIVSSEITEDSIIPIIPYVREKIALAMANAQEETTINGDVVATTLNIDGNTTATDRRHAYDGYRKAIEQAGTTSDASGGLTLTKVRKLRTDMGKWGIDIGQLCYVVGINVYNQLLSLEQVITIDKFGPRATILNGQLGSLDGIPILVSEFVYENLDASGLNAGSGATSQMILVRRDAFRYADRRQITLESMRRIETDQQVMVSLQRLDFKSMYTPSSSNTVAAAAVGITLT
jgi:HK97 family phage major capsid protein